MIRYFYHNLVKPFFSNFPFFKIFDRIFLHPNSESWIHFQPQNSNWCIKFFFYLLDLFHFWRNFFSYDSWGIESINWKKSCTEVFFNSSLNERMSIFSQFCLFLSTIFKKKTCKMRWTCCRDCVGIICYCFSRPNPVLRSRNLAAARYSSM